jgi:TorA maturation chaperone TorD
MGSASLLAQRKTKYDGPPVAETGDMARPLLSEEDRLRGATYRLLATLLSVPPSKSMLEQIAGLVGNDTTYGHALEALSKAAIAATDRSVELEFHDLFIGMGEGELTPYGSYYLTGFLHERPLARGRKDMRSLGIARADGVSEPEDGMAGLCEIMAGLIDGDFGAPLPIDGQRGFFEAHLAPWAGRFFSDLEAAESAAFYRPVGALGRAFIDIETEALSITN